MYKTMVAMTGILLLGAAVHADEIQLPHVTVYGTATTEVIPDRMIWTVSVTTIGPSVAEIAGQHVQAVSQVLAFLKGAKVAENEIQSTNMQLGEHQVYKDNSWVKEGYRASTALSFKASNFDAYKDLWLGLVAINGVSIDGVYYDHSQRITLQNETRLKAVVAAKEKAVSLAKALGSEAGEPLLIEEDPSSQQSGRPTNYLACMTSVAGAGSSSDDSATVVAPGQIQIQSRIKVAFRLITGRP
jgi:uncharacterized protein